MGGEMGKERGEESREESGEIPEGIGTLFVREAAQGDAAGLVRIYNSNRSFLEHHLGRDRIDEGFIREEWAQMQKNGFLSCVIEEKESGRLLGALDYRPGVCTYLSLLLLDAEIQGQGIGARCAALLESAARRNGGEKIRIDVVRGYCGNAEGFWRRQGFVPVETTELCWGEKRSEALVMVKRLAEPETER